MAKNGHLAKNLGGFNTQSKITVIYRERNQSCKHPPGEAEVIYIYLRRGVVPNEKSKKVDVRGILYARLERRPIS